MNVAASIEPCPICRDASALRSKLLLIDEAWSPAPGDDPRLAYYADLRVDDVRPEHTKDSPLEQFVEGYFCATCGKGFVAEAVLRDTRRRYR